ncbi:hypothetical protein C8J57DRAFT_1484714 [Mycena rebaudengoi]|nr:hypothetical protein C8J57DRAFT_1484714 [Mycena rebaudengoi]
MVPLIRISEAINYPIKTTAPYGSFHSAQDTQTVKAVTVKRHLAGAITNSQHSPGSAVMATRFRTPNTAKCKDKYLSQLVFHWLSPFLDVGFSRPLEKDDLWELPEPHLTGPTTDALEAHFYARCPPDWRPAFLRSANRESTAEKLLVDTDVKKKSEDPTSRRKTRFWHRKPKQQYDQSLFRTLHATFFYRIWWAGLLKLLAGSSVAFLHNRWAQVDPRHAKDDDSPVEQVDSYVVHHASDAQNASGLLPKPQGIGYGIGLAFSLLAMQRFDDSRALRLRLSARARLQHSVAQTTTIISTDSARLDRYAMFGHNLWVSPIQILLGIGLLLGNLGYSGLVGLGVLLLGFPLQYILVRIMFLQRSKGVEITDSRVRLTNEVLQGIRLIKYYAWEDFYTHQIGTLRQREIATVRNMGLARSFLMALVTFIPILASILSFITYALSGHELNIAIIFSSLQPLQPLTVSGEDHPGAPHPLPVCAGLSFGRSGGACPIGKLLTAEELEDPYPIDTELENAVHVDASFTWETAGHLEEQDAKKEKGRTRRTRRRRASVPKGGFVAIVGKVGSGKVQCVPLLSQGLANGIGSQSSILQALIGEMRRTTGKVVFGGTTAYVPQSAWIQNATVRENIVFGKEDDEERFRQIIRACSLEHDLEMLPHGEATEVDPYGSRRPQARVSLARAAYSPSDVVLLDDPLSAVDSFVGKAILENCLLSGPLANRTRILVTHALHVLDKTDYIYVMDNGIIREQGTYAHLMANGGPQASKVKGEQAAIMADDHGGVNTTQAALMQIEERNIGAVEWETYRKYLKFGGGAAQVCNNLFLSFWTGGTLGFAQGEYMAVYAGLGFAQALLTFFLTFTFTLLALAAGSNLFRTALRSILHSPSSFFDTTPMGRIVSRLVKDQETLDNQLALTLSQFLGSFTSVLGTVALVFYTFPYLGIIFAPMTLIYYVVSVYYRRSSVETKRLDSLMRSKLYASFSGGSTSPRPPLHLTLELPETLTGLATIRAYRVQDSAIKDAEAGLDLENRAYFMTITLQQWLAVRLDVLANLLLSASVCSLPDYVTTSSQARLASCCPTA